MTKSGFFLNRGRVIIRPGTPASGWTLIELLIGLTIFALIAVSVQSVFFQGIRINRRARRVERVYRDTLWAVETLTRDLENTVAYRWIPPSGQAQSVVVNRDATHRQPIDLVYQSAAAVKGSFVGQKDSLSFIVAAEDGLKEIKYYLISPEQENIHRVTVREATTKNVAVRLEQNQNTRAQVLVREENPFPRLREEETNPEGLEVLHPNIREESLQFFYVKKFDDKMTGDIPWEENWTESFLPAGVRVRMDVVDPENADDIFPVQKDIFIPLGGWGGGSY